MLAACGSPSTQATTDAPLYGGGDAPRATDAQIDGPITVKRTIFVIPMENEPSSAIYGSSDAPYINSLMASAAYATNFQDELPSLPSEPHYVWMEAGTNQFDDITFTIARGERVVPKLGWRVAPAWSCSCVAASPCSASRSTRCGTACSART